MAADKKPVAYHVKVFLHQQTQQQEDKEAWQSDTAEKVAAPICFVVDERLLGNLAAQLQDKDPLSFILVEDSGSKRQTYFDTASISQVDIWPVFKELDL